MELPDEISLEDELGEDAEEDEEEEEEEAEDLCRFLKNLSTTLEKFLD